MSTTELERTNLEAHVDLCAERYKELFYRTEGLNLLTDEQRDFAETLLTGDSWFDIEFLVGQDGQCKDIFFLHHVVNEFKELTAS